MDTNNNETHTAIVYDYGGIWDPVDGKVPGEHYGTTFFGYLSALMYRDTGENQFLYRAIAAGRFHINTSVDEYYEPSYEYHWAFNNLAFIETYCLIKRHLSREERDRWERCILNWKELFRHPVTNWQIMRAYSYLLRYKLFKKPLDMVYHLYFSLHLRRGIQTLDGCVYDIKDNTCPLQYHAYVLAILHKLYILSKGEFIKVMFIKGINYILPFIDPDGDFNYMGRGQRQIFGYSSLIYALEAAKNIVPERAIEYQHYLDLVWNYFSSYQRKDGYFPLILTETDEHDQPVWYRYHHLTVYNAFTALWLYEAGKMASPATDGYKEQKKTLTYFNTTGTIIASMDKYYAVISGGERKYLADGGLTFQHIWVQGLGAFFSCPGGPSGKHLVNLEGQDNFYKNFLAPIAMSDGVWFCPAFSRGEVKRINSETFVIKYNYGPFTVTRTIIFNADNIDVNDYILFTKCKRYNEFRIFNMPFSPSTCEANEAIGSTGGGLTLTSTKKPDSNVKIDIEYTDGEDSIFSVDERILATYGPMIVCSRKHINFECHEGKALKIGFIMRF
ncbi:glycosyltransferase [Candidatus Omnitrophus magneticus]|uniref:Glycosyltransferase n=1 Tax=Candidatus Omnitrophus magneticus TaxID=1609969 RepID=A0A0F0CRN3_9BACT|nr:glycosyltransferase [Candidatus Omnitrophus magneticus]